MNSMLTILFLDAQQAEASRRADRPRVAARSERRARPRRRFRF